MVTSPQGAKRKVMLTRENTSLDIKAEKEIINLFSSPSKIRLPSGFREERAAVETIPLFIPNREQQEAASLAQRALSEPPNTDTSLLGYEQSCLSALFFALNADVTKRTQSPMGLPQGSV